MLRGVVNRLRFGPMSGIGPGALYTVAYIAASSSLYFALGVVTEQSLALTPFVFLVGGLFFAMIFATYVEGSSLHIERGGASSFARYAFDELVSFVAGWTILLDYAIVLALVTLAVPEYLAPVWSGFSTQLAVLVIPVALNALMAWTNIRGVNAMALRRRMPIGWFDLLVLLAMVFVGLTLVSDTSTLTDSVELGVTPTWAGLLTALLLTTVAGTGIEAASGLAGEIRIGRRELRAVVISTSLSTVAIFAGVSLVALMVDPVTVTAGSPATPITEEYLAAPVLGVAAGLPGGWAGDVFTWLVVLTATTVLIGAARIYMLGPMRMTYALATNRQIPSVLGRLHPEHGTPHVAAVLFACFASALALLGDVELLMSIFAFGALLAFSIGTLSIIVLRFREPDAVRAYRVPGSLPVGRGSLPLPSLIAFVASAASFVALFFLRQTAVLGGLIWLALGLAMYVVHRRAHGRPLRQRVTIPEEDLRRRALDDVDVSGYGSILVPVFGGVLDDDIVGTAGRLAMEEGFDEGEGGAVIEALHVIEIPMSQPIDAPVPPERLTRARQILARAKEVGEEYQGVEVATATVRARSTGEAIVREAARRGVELIVLAAERPSRIRGGPLLGGVEPRAAEFIGKVTEYVTRKAPCRVLLTAPPETDVAALAESIAANPHVSAEFARREADRVERMEGLTEEHSPVTPAAVHPTDAVRPHEADQPVAATDENDDENLDDFIDTIA